MSDTKLDDPGPEAPRVFGRRRTDAAPEIEERDFRGAPRPAPAERRELEALATRVADRVARAIGNYLRLVAKTQTMAPDLLEYAEAVRAFRERDWIVPLVADGGDRAVLRADEGMQNLMLMQLLGGVPSPKADGQPHDDEAQVFEYEPALTLEYGPISRAAMKPLVRAFLREWNLLLRDGGAPYAIDAARESLPPSRQLRGSDSVVTFECEVTLGAERGRIQLVVLASSLTALLDVAPPERPAPAKADPAQKRGLESVVRALDVEVAVELGSASIALKDYLALGVGDVMILDRRVGEPLRVAAGDAAEFAAQPGRSGEKLAVRIVGRKDREAAP